MGLCYCRLAGIKKPLSTPQLSETTCGEARGGSALGIKSSTEVASVVCAEASPPIRPRCTAAAEETCFHLVKN